MCYQEKGSVVLTVNITYQMMTTFPNNIEIWFQRLEDHNFTIQTCELISTNYDHATEHQLDQDIKNNTVEYFEFELDTADIFRYTATYRLRLAHLEWDITDDITENNDSTFEDAFIQAGIDASDSWYQQFTRSENNLEAHNSELITLTEDICKGKTTLQEKIRVLLSWLNENIEGKPTQESQGAYKTFFRKVGDCSDFATMFVTMLRILKVPARKITGVQLFHPPSYSFYPFFKGETFSYYGTKYDDYLYDSNFLGHAWVEYYHPNYGWICLDPTFARRNPQKYMNYIGYHYMTSSIGENYYEGIDPPFPHPIAGLGAFPYMTSDYPTGLRWNYTMDIEVEETMGYTYIPKIINDLFPILIMGGGFWLVFFAVFLYRKKKKQNNT